MRVASKLAVFEALRHSVMLLNEANVPIPKPMTRDMVTT